MTDPEPQHIFTLHRYYLCSTLLKGHFDEALSSAGALGQPFSVESESGIRGLAYMSYWYASLWVVIEGWSRLGLQDERITNLLASDHAKQLKLYRHGVFHFHEDYFSRLAVGFVREQDAVPWVHELSNELGRWFLAWFAAREEEEEE